MATRRPSSHRRMQKRVKEVEGYYCLVCGRFTKRSAGHHLLCYAEGGSADLQNLMTLCETCHRKYHRGELKIDIHRF